jgi:hypothetical protein
VAVNAVSGDLLERDVAGFKSNSRAHHLNCALTFVQPPFIQVYSTGGVIEL